MAGMNYFSQVQHSQLPQVIDPRQAMAIAASKGDAPSQVAMPNAISQAQIQQYLPVAAMAGGNTDFETKPAFGSWLLQQSSRIEQDQLDIKAEPETIPPNNCQGVTSLTYQTKSFQAASQEAEEKSVFRCPDCPKVFKHVSGVYIHASQTHYASHLQNAFLSCVESSSCCPLCSKPLDKSRYLTHIGAKHKRIMAFMDHEKREAYVNIERNGRVGKKGKKKSSDPSPNFIPDKFRCPDCDKPFAFVAPLYIHAAITHYNDQIKAKYVPVYREHGKCHLCGSLVSSASLVSHYGGKHERILSFMDDAKRASYLSMKKRSWTNFKDTGGLSCTFQDCTRTFKNLTMYKQHLANTHVRTELLRQARLATDSKCEICGKVMPKPYALLQHLGTCHNQILNYVPLNVKQQLAHLGVKDPTCSGD